MAWKNRVKNSNAVSAGEMRHKVGFFKRGTVSDDGYGNTQTGFPDEPELTTHAAVRARFGGETVLAQRLQGQETYTITVHQSEASKQITVDWMAKDMRKGTTWNIVSGPVDPTDEGHYFEFLCQSGSAA